MSSSFYYPPLQEATLKALSVVRTLIQEAPNYFSESPYSEETDDLLKEWFASNSPAPAPIPSPSEANVQEPAEGESIFEGLKEEIKQTYLHLKSAKHDTGQDKLAYAKAAVGMLEKLVKMEAAVVNIELVGNFQRAMMDIMEEVCSPSQRVEVMRRVSTFLAAPESISQVLPELDQEDDSFTPSL